MEIGETMPKNPPWFRLADLAKLSCHRHRHRDAVGNRGGRSRPCRRAGPHRRIDRQSQVELLSSQHGRRIRLIAGEQHQAVHRLPGRLI
jgi:hypothetical protein